MFLAAIRADDTEIEAAFHESIRVAKQQKSFALLKRAEASYADYRPDALKATKFVALIL